MKLPVMKMLKAYSVPADRLGNVQPDYGYALKLLYRIEKERPEYMRNLLRTTPR